MHFQAAHTLEAQGLGNVSFLLGQKVSCAWLGKEGGELSGCVPVKSVAVVRLGRTYAELIAVEAAG